MTKPDADLRDRIYDTFRQVFSAQHADRQPPRLSDESVLLETGLDSLGFAILVTRLEEELGYDPFTIATEAYYPQTFGEFVRFYGENRPG